ncbi:Golgi-associated plant pathogenesis-related protein 1-like [Mytilus trossulus]|uniref:Golgi-associated plant pathogenesis-related protein 1-like n=1 Tax=Mytilus trossulus TaxID=6551 RepID=UPI0030069456
MVESTREPQNSDCTKQTEEDFQREAVREHNTLRQRHGVPPLSLAQDLCVLAQEWANYLINNNKHGHSSNKLGENLADKAGNYPNLDYAGREVTKYWYSENENYQFYGMEPPSYEEIGEDKEYGHFTQVVWKGSREMGIGKAKKDDRVVVVANYRPAGNCIGFYAKNVFPPK